MDLNLKSPFFLLQKLLPLLRAGATAERPATVINIGSVGALKIGPREVYAYQASKAAIHWLAKSMAKKLGPRAHHRQRDRARLLRMRHDRDHVDEAMRAMVVVDGPAPPHRRAPRTWPAPRSTSPRAPAAYVTGSVIPVEGGLAI